MEEFILISLLPVSPALWGWDLSPLSLAVTAGLGQQTLPKVPSSFHTPLPLPSPLTIPLPVASLYWEFMFLNENFPKPEAQQEFVE